MPSLNECLEQAVAAGRITQKEATQVASDIDEIERQLTIDGKMSPEAARKLVEYYRELRQALRQALRTRKQRRARERRAGGRLWRRLARSTGTGSVNKLSGQPRTPPLSVREKALRITGCLLRVTQTGVKGSLRVS